MWFFKCGYDVFVVIYFKICESLKGLKIYLFFGLVKGIKLMLIGILIKVICIWVINDLKWRLGNFFFIFWVWFVVN